MSVDPTPLNLLEYEAAARQRLSTMAWDYYAGGANDEITLRENRVAYDRIPLRYHVLRDVSDRDLSTTVLGQRLAMPVLVGPTAFQGMAHPDAELASVRAAGAAGTIMVLSTLSSASLEDVSAEATGATWFQLYVYKDRAATVELIRRVEASGYSTLMVTVDAPVLGRRERDIRNRFQVPPWRSPRGRSILGSNRVPRREGSELAEYFGSAIDPSLSWKDVAWLQGVTRLPIVIKGLVRADDAVQAADHGVAGVVVSNHGGRQLDTAPPTIDVLGDVAEAVGDRLTVLMDGGIRRGTDVVKALARGAAAVMIARPVLWGLAVGGETGVLQVLDLLRGELDAAMALCGCAALADITPDLLG